MKKILVLFVFSAFIFGCETSDNETPTASIIGVWNGISINFTGTGAAEIQGVPVTADVDGEGYDIDYTVTFTEDPNTVTTVGIFSVEATASIQGQTYTESEENISIDFSGPWNQDGNTLALTINGEDVIANIVELTETSLVLQFIIERVETINGVAITADVDVNAS
ncbi:MAG: hypothetical protein PSN34_13820, partial [Urechidicola sp.]|nr:hypothetical protein [Urechidicola sp.]